VVQVHIMAAAVAEHAMLTVQLMAQVVLEAVETLL
jgi:hypothetical protein